MKISQLLLKHGAAKGLTLA